jgi:hypothetical protein
MSGKVHMPPVGNFDEIAVGHWLHVEMMDNRSAFVNLGGRCYWLHMPRTGEVQITHAEDRREFIPAPAKRGRKGGRRA